MSNDKHYHVQRLSDREFSERDAINEFLDNEFLAHVGFVEKTTNEPFVIPMGYARDGDRILLHGSTGSRMMMAIAKRIDICVTVTQLNAIVVARSAFNSSMNYRSVMAFGVTQVLEEEEKSAAMKALTEKLIPGLWEGGRPMTAKEFAQTMIVALPLDDVTAKQRSGEALDGEDATLDIWAGQIPIITKFGEPITNQDSSHLPVPDYIRRFGERGQ